MTATSARLVRLLNMVPYFQANPRISYTEAATGLGVSVSGGGVVGVHDAQDAVVDAQQQLAEQRVGEVAAEHHLLGGHLRDEAVALGQHQGERDGEQRGAHEVELAQRRGRGLGAVPLVDLGGEGTPAQRVEVGRDRGEGLG